MAGKKIQKRFSPLDVAEALKQARGFMGEAAKLLNCSRTTIHTYVKRYKFLQQLLEEIREANIDFAESKLFQAIERGEAWAITFFLKTQAKHRGYVEKQELGTSGGVPFVLKIVKQE